MKQKSQRPSWTLASQVSSSQFKYRCSGQRCAHDKANRIAASTSSIFRRGSHEGMSRKQKVLHILLFRLAGCLFYGGLGM